jgi:hypothetical protein
MARILLPEAVRERTGSISERTLYIKPDSRGRTAPLRVSMFPRDELFSGEIF